MSMWGKGIEKIPCALCGQINMKQFSIVQPGLMDGNEYLPEEYFCSERHRAEYCGEDYNPENDPEYIYESDNSPDTIEEANGET